ncbi:NUDIX domain-containing protein [Streptomyces sp. NPDC047061]|uniref:NUDIX domain-containing protein n=1 Tax=Streptomyces sp. NPDC047061 TaxID=3154605 RepID=UPI0033EE4F52
MPNEPVYEGRPVADRRTGGRPPALRPAVESMTLLAAAVIVHDKENDRVVLLQRGPGAKYGNGLWDLPAGKSDPGEPVTGTAVRELREETGLVVDPESLRVAHLIHGAWGVEAPGGFLTVVFATHEWTGEPVNAEPAKHVQVRWTGTDAIPEAIVPTTGIALGHYLRGGTHLSIAGFGDAD